MNLKDQPSEKQHCAVPLRGRIYSCWIFNILKILHKTANTVIIEDIENRRKPSFQKYLYAGNSTVLYVSFGCLMLLLPREMFIVNNDRR